MDLSIPDILESAISNRDDLIMENNDSILGSVKEFLGINELDDFDKELFIHINSAIATLTQLGVGPRSGFEVKSSDDSYLDFLGESHASVKSLVKDYICFKTKVGFDSSSASSALLQTIKDSIIELEWRILYQLEVEGKMEE